VSAVQRDSGVEVRQGVRAEREVQGGQVHPGGGVAVQCYVTSCARGGGGPLLRGRIGVAVGYWGHIWEFYRHGGGPAAYSGRWFEHLLWFGHGCGVGEL
jgi:hypothetical protein